MFLAPFVAVAIGMSSASPEANLTWHEFVAGESFEAGLPSTSYMERPAGAVLAGYRGPGGISKPRFFVISRGKGKATAGVVGQSKSGGATERVWIDWNGDKVFAGSEEGKPSPKKELRYGT